MQLSIVLFQTFAYSNVTITFLTGLFTLPWALKIFLSPLTATYGRQSTWLIGTQSCCVLLVLFIAFHISAPLNLYPLTIAFVLLAFASSLNDIVTDGLYITQLGDSDQRFFIGMRTIFYQIGNLLCGGVALAIVASISHHTSVSGAWRYFFILLTTLMALLTFWHYRVFRNDTPTEKKNASLKTSLAAMFDDIKQLPRPVILIALIFIYDLPNAIQSKIFPLFFLDRTTQQGLALAANHYSFISSLGIGAMLVAVFLSGWILLRTRLKTYIVLLTILFAISYLFFLPLIYWHASFLFACAAFAMHQFLFGLVNSGYMMLLVQSARQAKQPVMLYSFFTTVMMLAQSLFGMSAGLLQLLVHYSGVFCLLAIVSVLIAGWVYRVSL